MQQNTFTQSFVQMLNIDEQRKDMFKQFLVDFFKFQIDAELDMINLEIEFSEDDEDSQSPRPKGRSLNSKGEWLG